MGVRVLRPRPKPTPHTRDAGDDLEIRTELEEGDGAGGVRRDGSVFLGTTDPHAGAAVNLAIRIFDDQEVRSLRFWNSGWTEMVPRCRDADVAADAESFRPAGDGRWWRGFRVPADALPRPFIATYTKFRLTNARPARQTIDWLACYAPGHFSGHHVTGHSHLEPHPHRTRTKKRR